MVIHDELLTALQSQPWSALTSTRPVPPDFGYVAWTGEIATAQPLVPFCATVNGRPAIVIVPLRAVAAGLASTENATLPLPLPFAPDVM